VLSFISKALQLIQTIDSKHLKLQLDIFHLQMLEGNLTNRIKELLPFTGKVHS
jgi:hydroxypyruvate isomerase